jgi:hypothetical protein
MTMLTAAVPPFDRGKLVAGEVIGGDRNTNRLAVT